GGWVLLSNQVTWQKWISPETIAAVSSLANHSTNAPAATAGVPAVGPEPAPKPAAVNPLPPEQQPATSNEIGGTSYADEKTSTSGGSPTSPTGADPAAADDAASSPLPPPTVDPADPYQTRAAAAGLNPGLSRALLARLTPTDYRNAGIAIRT